MSIHLYGSTAAAAVDTIDKTSKASGTTAVKTSGQAAARHPSTEDTTTLSSSASVKSLTTTALQTTPTREQKVALLKQAVNNAEYQLDAAKIAESLSSSDL